MELNKRTINFFLFKDSNDAIAFDAFKEASKETGGHITSSRTLEQLNEKYEITAEKTEQWLSAETEKLGTEYKSKTTYTRLPFQTECIHRQCFDNLTHKKPVIIDGLENLMVGNDSVEDTITLLNGILQLADDNNTLVIIPINEQLYKQKLSAYFDRRVAKYDSSS